MGSVVAVIGGISGLLGAGLQAGSQYMAGEQQSEYYQNLAEQNEKQAPEVIKTAQEQRGLIQDTASRQSQKLRTGLKDIIAKQKTAFASSNIDLSSKTAEDVARSSFNQELEDEMLIRYKADVSSWQTTKSAEQTASNLLGEARGYRKAGKYAKQAGVINAITSLLGNASKFIG
jgi:hypothetical protein